MIIFNGKMTKEEKKRRKKNLKSLRKKNKDSKKKEARELKLSKQQSIKNINKLKNKWIEVMAHLKIENMLDETFTLIDIKEQVYGYECLIKIAPGLSFTMLEKESVKSSIEGNLSCIFELSIIPKSDKAKAKFITKTLTNIDFKPVKLKPYEVCFPYLIDGSPLVASMLDYPHIVIQGSNGMGKTKLIDSIIVNLMKSCTEEELQFTIIQVDKSDQIIYKNCKHVYCYAKELNEICIAIIHLAKMIKINNNMLEPYIESGLCNNIKEYNDCIDKGLIKGEKLKYHYLVIDEYASLMPSQESDKYYKYIKSVIQKSMAEIIRMGRSTGLYCILATQRGTIDMMPSFIKNMANTKATMKVNGLKSTEVNGFPNSDKLLKRDFMVETDKIYLGRTGNLTPEDVLNYIKEFKIPNKPNFDFSKYTHYLEEYGIIALELYKDQQKEKKKKRNKKDKNDEDDIETITIKDGNMYDEDNEIIELEEPIEPTKITNKKTSKVKGTRVQEKLPEKVKSTPKIKSTTKIKDIPKVKDTEKEKNTENKSSSNANKKNSPKLKNEVFKIHQNKSPYYDPNWVDIEKNPNIKIIDERNLKKHD